ncbi:MAG: hypothetical protein E7313_05635 [Clostridiales bacterium]|nr:hypothetical protein [Clostridiales bacterium]
MKNEKINYYRLDNRNYIKKHEKILRIYRKVFIKIIVENIDNGKIIVLPMYKKINKISKKIILNKLEKIDGRICVLDKKLNGLLLEFLEDKKRKCLDGKEIMKNMIYEIFVYIMKKRKTNCKLENIYIFVNEYSKINIQLIKRMAMQFKTVNIITENLRKFKYLEEELYAQGILITVANNKKKSAKNANYIVNIDFDKELFEKYNINMNSVIINLTDEKIFYEKMFNGILVNNLNINIDKDIEILKEENYGNIENKLYIESYVIGNKFVNYDTLIKEYNISIKELIGVRGVIENL